MPARTGGAALAVAIGASSESVASVNVRSRMCPSLRIMLMNKFSGADRMEAPCRKHGASIKNMTLRSEAIKTSCTRDVIGNVFFLTRFLPRAEVRPASTCGTGFGLESFLSQIAAEALDALAGVFEIGGFGRVGNPECRAETERGALHDGDAFALQQLGDKILVVGDHLAGWRGLA